MNLKKYTKTKNLLAFSSGIDSTALFFKLLNAQIEFDIIIVDYQLREQSKEEVLYAQELADKFNKKCYLKISTLEKFNEKSARDFRYDFFEKVIKENNYSHLFMGHHLNDKLEWFLMQLSKGAGLSELNGLKEINKKEHYTIVRPLIETPKKELLNYLNKNKIKFFIDETNTDEKYKRNIFRNNYSNQLIEDYENGIRNSFKYLEQDEESLIKPMRIYTKYSHREEVKKVFITFIKNKNDTVNIREISQYLKKNFGLVISSDTREDILDENYNIVISGKVAISIQEGFDYSDEDKICIAPYVKDFTMPKKVKEKFRKELIPPKLRNFIFKELGEEYILS